MINFISSQYVNSYKIENNKHTKLTPFYGILNCNDIVSFSGKSISKVQQYTHKDLIELYKLMAKMKDTKSPEDILACNNKKLEIAEKNYLYPEQNLSLAKKHKLTSSINDANDLALENIEEITNLITNNEALNINIDKYLSHIDSLINSLNNVDKQKLKLIATSLKMVCLKKDQMTEIQTTKLDKLITKLENNDNYNINKAILLDYIGYNKQNENDSTLTKIEPSEESLEVVNFDRYIHLLRRRPDAIDELTSLYEKLISILEESSTIELTPEYCLETLSIHTKLIFNILEENIDDPIAINCTKTFLNLLMCVYGYLEENEYKNIIQEPFFYILQEPKYKPLHNIAAFFFNCISEEIDADFHQLVKISNKIKEMEDYSSPEYYEARSDLLKQEFKILVQEFTQPKKYFDRATMMHAFQDLPSKYAECVKLLKNNALSGISTSLNTITDFNIEIDPDIVLLLADNILKVPENEDFNQSSVKNAFIILCFIYPILACDQKQKVDHYLLDRFNNSTNNELKLQIVDLVNKDVFNNTSIQETINTSLLKNYDSFEEKDKADLLITLIKTKKPEINNILVDILKNPDSYSEKMYKTAIWGAGIYKSNYSFKKLIDIINPKKLKIKQKLEPKEMRLAELAIYSLVRYEDKRVLQILNIISESGTDLAEVAKAILDIVKVENTGNKDYSINTLLKPVCKPDTFLSEKDQYKNYRNKFIPDYESLSVVQQNDIDKILVPFRSVLLEHVLNNKSTSVSSDIATIENKYFIGKRNGYSSFFDSAGGIGGSNITIDKKTFLNEVYGSSLFAHEWGHCIHSYLIKYQPEMDKKIEELYCNAQRNGFMDDYSEINYKEYFAQANEAYFSIFKTHNSIIERNNNYRGFDNTRLKLKQVDPEMFKFIDELYNSFNKINIQKQLNLII
ncbi:MAG: hypothetical protein AB7V50_04475 [Vampirovibrionia bacterium]